MYAACAALCCGLLATSCQTSSSATDHEAQHEEVQKIEHENRALERVELKEQRAWHAFTNRFKGQIKAGEKCDVCPDTCAVVDLRTMEASKFQQAYRQMVADLTTSRDSHVLRVAMHEHQRLLCIVRGDASIRESLVQLLSAVESPEVRYHSAIDAAELGVGQSEFRQVLQDVADGSGFTSQLAQLRIEKWNKEGWPNE